MALIVRAADGSVRDGLSLFDQAIANAKDQITTDTIISMLGLADRGNIFDLLDAIFSGDAKTSLKIYNKIYQSCADILLSNKSGKVLINNTAPRMFSSDVKSPLLIFLLMFIS